MKYVLIYNWQASIDDWFAKKIMDQGHEVVILDNTHGEKLRYKKWYRIFNVLHCFLMALRAIGVDKDSVIISMCATPGIIAAILDKKRHKILALNLLCHHSVKPSLGEKLRNMLYTEAFRNNNLMATCNTLEEIEKNAKIFSIENHKRMIVLEDAFNLDIAQDDYISEKGSYIFSGGASVRDWDTVVKAAKKLPEVQFHIVAREEDWPKSTDVDNIKTRFNVSMKEFYQDAFKSYALAIALNSTKTAGLLVVFQAIAHGKLTIVTKTPATSRVIPEEYHKMLLVEMFDADDLSNKINKVLELESKEYCKISDEIRKHLMDNYSQDAYFMKIWNLLN